MNRENGHATLKIAETRYAIKCDYAPFVDWLHEACADFLVEGEPHARLTLNFITTGKEAANEPDLVHKYNENGTSFNITWKGIEDLDDMYRSMLRLFLQLSPVKNKAADLWVHASAVVHNNQAFLFTGPSGAGKTTICNILSGREGFTILHDDVVILSPSVDGFRAWSSPMHGQKPASRSISAPLRALFFIHQGKINYISRLPSRSVPGLIAPGVMLTPWIRTPDGQIYDNMKLSLDLILRLAEVVPCYELHFKPDFSFWELIEQALEEVPSGRSRVSGQ
jgi:hypothetical protein